MEKKFKSVIGRVEHISLPEFEVEDIYGKVDTGAHRSSIDTSFVKEEDGVLRFVLFQKDSPYYTGKELSSKKFRTVYINNSFGDRQKRYQIMMKIKLGKKTVKTGMTLADRSKKLYPVLLGRKFLNGRYIVDVSEGSPHPEDEES